MSQRRRPGRGKRRGGARGAGAGRDTTATRDTAARVPRTVHDGFFKEVFGDPALAADELRAILPAELAARIDWASLAPMPASFVDEVLAQRVGDLVFCARVTEGEEVLLWFLIEHQRKEEWWMILRVLDMHGKMWRHWRQLHPGARTVPAILPVVVYHGTRPWQAPRSMRELYGSTGDTLFAPHLLACGFVLDDLCAASDDELRARHMDAFARLSLFAMARAAADDFLDRLTGDWRAELSDMAVAGNVERLVVFLRYTLHVNRHVDLEMLRARLLPLVGEDVEEAIVTVADKLKQEGFDRGLERGLEQERRRLLLRLLGQRAEPLPESLLGRVGAASVDDLQRWFDRTLGAATLDEIFAES
jgi:hypothetical protein